MPVYALYAVSLQAAHFLSPRRSLRNLLLGGTAAIAAFAVTNPYMLLHWKDLLWELHSTGNIYSSVFSKSLLLYFYRQLPVGLTYGLLGVFLWGVLASLQRREKADIVLVVTALVPLAVFAVLLQAYPVSVHNVRFILPAVVVLLVLGSSAVDRALRNRHFAIPAALLAALVFVHAGLKSEVYARNFSEDGSVNSTRLAAGQWISRNIPAGSYIGFKNVPEPSYVPPFNFQEYRIAVIRDPAVLPPVEYAVVEYEVPDEWVKNGFTAHYQLMKSFSPGTSLFGISFDTGKSSVNAPLYIYRRID